MKYRPCVVSALTVCRETGYRTVADGQFNWGGFLLKCNGGAQRYPQPGWQSGGERKRIRVLDCKTYKSSRCESRR